MERRRNGSDHLVCSLSIASLALMLACFTDLGQMKIFRFIAGEAAVVTAIAYCFQATRKLGKSTLFLVALWFVIASFHFAQAIWFVAKQYGGGHPMSPSRTITVRLGLSLFIDLNLIIFIKEIALQNGKAGLGNPPPRE